jgi:DNA-binding MarR family transcriptional regulator
MIDPDPSEHADDRARDSVDSVLAQWAALRPDLDFGPLAVTMRLSRVRGHIEAELDPVFRAHGLSTPDFAALITLIRITDTNGVSQHRLAGELGLTAGTVSVRIDRLVRAKLAVREPDPTSKRRTLIAPTPSGRELFERIVPRHLATENRLLTALSDTQQVQLAELLRTLLAEFESPQPSALTRTGLDLAPAHETIAIRAAVGLPRTPGLLIRAVEPDSSADRAGLRPGDVLIAAAEHELRSRAQLNAALHDAGPDPITLIALRGEHQFATRVDHR